LLDAEELVDVGMNFVSDLFAGLEAHDHKLTMLAGEKNLAKIRVFEGLALDRSKIAGHRFILLCS
jgi:hypothetical protein